MAGLHASPAKLDAKYLELWAKYILRDKEGSFMIILGTDQTADPRNPCGPCPYKYLALYADVSESESDVKVGLYECDGTHLHLMSYVTIDLEAFKALKSSALGEVCWVRTNDRSFEGHGRTIKAEPMSSSVVKEIEEMARSGEMFGQKAFISPESQPDNTPQNQRNLFCTSCGARYPTETANFCGMCGNKR